MIVYSYDSGTNEFTGKTQAFESPLEPEIFLIPANATTIAPPRFDASKEQCFWTNGQWTVSPIALGSVPGSPTADEILAAAWRAYQDQAKALLTKTDTTILRCAEYGVAVPAEWQAYRKSLRLIISAANGDPSKSLPLLPAFPIGT